MGFLCCGLPTLVASAALFVAFPKLRIGIVALWGIGGCLLATALGIALNEDRRDAPLIAALDAQDPRAVEKAIRGGSSVRADIGTDSSCPVLFKAIRYGDAESTEVLLRYGADPNQSGDGQSPLMAAYGNPKIVALLKRYGARS